VRAARHASSGNRRLLVSARGEWRLIDAAAIHALEADDNYVHVSTAEQGYMLRRTLRDLLLQLGEDAFVRIHKSAAVAVSQIEALAPLAKGDYELRLKSGRRLRLSRRYAADFFARIDA
jgi:two-component system LytT family response regulator